MNYKSKSGLAIKKVTSYFCHFFWPSGILKVLLILFLLFLPISNRIQKVFNNSKIYNLFSFPKKKNIIIGLTIFYILLFQSILKTVNKPRNGKHWTMIIIIYINGYHLHLNYRFHSLLILSYLTNFALPKNWRPCQLPLLQRPCYGPVANSPRPYF